jgi:hypothetical protein
MPESPDGWVVPSDGMCLSVFLVVRPADRTGQVLLGKLDASAPERELSALGPDRVERPRERWVRLASQLHLFEAPDKAARRVAREQLEMEFPDLPAPHVLSET